MPTSSYTKVQDYAEQVNKGVHKRGIAACCFGHGESTRVITVGSDDDHYVCVWDWKNGQGKIAGERCLEHVMRSDSG